MGKWDAFPKRFKILATMNMNEASLAIDVADLQVQAFFQAKPHRIDGPEIDCHSLSRARFCPQGEYHRCSMKLNNFAILSESQSPQREQITRRQKDRQILRAPDILHFAFCILHLSFLLFQWLGSSELNATVIDEVLLSQRLCQIVM